MHKRRQGSKYIIRSTQNGFSLIELAVVLFIIGLLVAGLLGPLATQLEQRERQQTIDVLKTIEESLYGFAIGNGRLICPDCTDNTGTCAALTANDGQEDRTGAAPNQICATAIGNLPWVDLGVPQLDAWDRRYMYRVTVNFADDADGTALAACSTTVGVSFQLCSAGNISVQEKGGACPVVATIPGSNPDGTPTAVANNIPALVYSEGKKLVTEQPLSCYQQENTDLDGIFVSTDFSQHEGADPADATLNYYYDDLVVWISPHILMNRMVNAGRLP